MKNEFGKDFLLKRIISSLSKDSRTYRKLYYKILLQNAQKPNPNESQQAIVECNVSLMSNNPPATVPSSSAPCYIYLNH